LPLYFDPVAKLRSPVAQVVTGDAVVLEVSAAAFPSRMVARLIDMITQIALLVILLILLSVTARHLSGAAVIAVWTVILVAVIIGYPTIFETLSRGKTLGKMAMGLRVVADDGGPERFRQALIRALTGIFEIWIFVFGPIALITSLASAKGKRLGDMFAGTYVITERVPKRRDLPSAFAVVPPQLAGWAAHLDLSGLPDRDAEAAGSYLRRYYDLQPAARDALGLQLAAAVAARVSPPPPLGTPPVAFLATVLAVRRERDHARLASRQLSLGAGEPAAASPATGTGQATGDVLPDSSVVSSPAPAARRDSASGDFAAPA
jgi:uncharacterized RDD family membrane protein YckC